MAVSKIDYIFSGIPDFVGFHVSILASAQVEFGGVFAILGSKSERVATFTSRTTAYTSTFERAVCN